MTGGFGVRGFTFGGGISNGGTLTIVNAAIVGNSASFGGGIGTGGALTISNSTISGNSATLGGGLYADGGTVTVGNSTISGNIVTSEPGVSPGTGGGITNANSTLNLSDSTITGNVSDNRGGGIVTSSGMSTAFNTIIALNSAGNGPEILGALTSQGYNLIGEISGGTVTAMRGDQIGVAAAQLNIGPLQDNRGPTRTHALLSGSTAIDRGNSSRFMDQRGLARPVDSLTISNALFGNGSDIGAYEVQPDILPGCSGTYEVLNNEDSGAGSLRGVIAGACSGSAITFPNVTGTIALTSGELLLTKSFTIAGPGARLLTISGNNASRIFEVAAGPAVAISGLTLANGNTVGVGSGAALLNSGTLVLSNCAVLNNSGGSGGGASNLGTLSVGNCTFAHNQRNGGALRNTGLLTITNSTFNDNSAESTGAISSFANAAPSATLTITNSTISGNRVLDPTNGRGGGIFNGSFSTARVTNTIVANNTAASGVDVSGVFTSGGRNVIRVVTGGTGFGVNGDLTGTGTFPRDPSLDPLADNGGPTDTMALRAGSIAIDLGDDSVAPATDQRGYLRSGVSDSGAYEFNGVPPSQVQVLGAVSRKVHGASGTFDIDLPLQGPAGIECRTGDAGGNHQVVVTFASAVSVAGVSITSIDGQASATRSVSGAVVTVDLSAVANAQTLGITLSGVSNGSATANVFLPVAILVGDTTSNGFVNATDIGQTKSFSGQPIDAANFRADVNLSGAINASDIGLVKAKAGTALPP